MQTNRLIGTADSVQRCSTLVNPAALLRLRGRLRSALRFFGRWQPFRRPTNDAATGLALNAPQILADKFQVAAELAGVLHAVTPNFLDNEIVHATHRYQDDSTASTGCACMTWSNETTT